MMKNLLFTLMLFAFSVCCYGQTTYYYVGGAGPFSFTSNNIWNTALDGSGTQRSAAAATDILIFDGTNISGAVPSTGTVSLTTGTASLGQLIIRNNAIVNIERSAAGSATTTTIGGDATAADDLVIGSGSALTISPQAGDAAGGIAISLSAGATGKINGTFNINGGSCRISSATATTTGAIFFESGSVCTANSVVSGQYPFTNATNKGVVFRSGSLLKFLGGNSIFSNTNTAVPIVFMPGSTCEFAAPVPSGSSVATNFFNNRSYANIIISGNATVLGSNFLTCENLTIQAGATFNMSASGTTPVSGNIVNNGTLGAATPIGSALLLMYGTTPQTISGSGTFNDIGAFGVATDANVTLQHSFNIPGAAINYILGTLDFGIYSLIGTGTVANTGRIQLRPAAVTTTSLAPTVAGSNVITFNAPDVATGYTPLGVAPGHLITGAQIPSNTYVVATNSAGTITMSNPATATNTAATITITGKPATVITSNPAGLDGSMVINANGSATYGIGSNYIFNVATTTPFTVNSTNSLGNVTFKANATANKNVTITGKLALTNAKLTIPTGTQISMSSTATFDGTFGQNAYVATDANTTSGAVGVLKVDLPVAANLIPVGTTTYYTPITVTPTTAAAFDINVFDGVTTDATANGTALNASQKQTLVNATYNITRTSGTGNAALTLGWQAAQEGSTFTTLAAADMGIGAYTAGVIGNFSGTGDNVANTVTNTFADFAQFIVGRNNSVLPVSLIAFAAQKQNTVVQLSWSTASEQRNSHFDVERSIDGKNFVFIGKRSGAGTSSSIQYYKFTDQNPVAGTNYYRLVQYDTDGKSTVIAPVAVNMGFGELSLKVLAANSSKDLTMNISAPNPSSGSLAVYNLSGQKIASQVLTVEKGNNSVSLALPALSPGVYIATYQSGTQIVREKFIK